MAAAGREAPGPRPNAGDAPEALVSDGNYSFGAWRGVPGRANLLDAARPYHYPVPRYIRNLRLKEWRSILAGNGRWLVSGFLFDAKFFSILSLDIWDRVDNERHKVRRVRPGGTAPKPRPSEVPTGSAMELYGAGMAIDIDPRGGTASLSARSQAPHGNAVSCRLGFDLSENACVPFSTCVPLSLNRAMYSSRILAPLHGEIALGDEAVTLDGADATGIVSEGKGYYPAGMSGDRVTAFGVDAGGRRIGLDLSATGERNRDQLTESCVWIGDSVWRIPEVKVTRPYGQAGAWIIQDTEGMVDLEFTPRTNNDIVLSLGVFRSEYHGPFGRFEGMVRAGSGETIDAARLVGRGERHFLRA